MTLVGWWNWERGGQPLREGGEQEEASGTFSSLAPAAAFPPASCTGQLLLIALSVCLSSLSALVSLQPVLMSATFSIVISSISKYLCSYKNWRNGPEKVKNFSAKVYFVSPLCNNINRTAGISFGAILLLFKKGKLQMIVYLDATTNSNTQYLLQ